METQPELASAFQVESIPTMAFIMGGKLAAKTSGLLPETKLRQALNQLVGAATDPARRVG